MVVAAVVCLVFGMSFKAGLAVGAMVALSSTAVVAPVLAKRAEIDSPHGRFCLGILLVQDAAVVPLVLLVTALGGQGTVGEVSLGAAKSMAIIAGFVVGAWLSARYILPAILRAATASGNREIVVLLAFAAAAGASFLAYQLNISPALGAFIVAIFLGESPLATQIRADVAPLKTLFVTMFFGSIGMLADPAFVAQNAHWVLLALALVALGKPLVMLPIALGFRLPVRHAVAAGMCMGQVGVFSFVLLQVATSGDAALVDDTVENILVAVIILSIFLTPYLVGGASTVGGWAELRLRRLGVVKTKAGAPVADEPRGDRGHVVIIGFGPAGRAVAEALKEQDTPIAMSDLNMRTVLSARSMGMRAIVGDATQAETLEALDLPSATALVITVPDHRLAQQIIRLARGIDPNVRIIARSRYSAYVGDLKRAGATVVVDEETTLGRRVGKALHDVLYAGDQATDDSIVTELR